MHRNIAAVAAALVLAACGGGEGIEIESGPSVQPAPPPATASAIPAGTMLEVELDQTIGVDHSRVGDRFSATVTEPLIAQNGAVVVPRGATVHGVVTGVAESDDDGDPAAIRVNFDRITIGSRSHPMSAAVVATEAEGESDDDLLETAGIGAAAGAVLGLIIGGDLEDILIGGALGAGVGTVIGLGLDDDDDELKAGTEMTLQTTSNVSLQH